MTFRTAGLILARAGEAGAFVEFERLWLDADHLSDAERVALDAFLDAAESPRGLFIDAADRAAERLSHQ